MFAQRGKTGYYEGDTKYKKQKPWRNIDHITCNYCGEKGHYVRNNEFSALTKLKEYSEALRKINQEKSGNKPLDVK